MFVTDIQHVGVAISCDSGASASKEKIGARHTMVMEKPVQLTEAD